MSDAAVINGRTTWPVSGGAALRLATMGSMVLRLPTLTAELRCSDAPEEGVMVRSITLTEGLDSDYRAELLLASHVEHDARAMLGADVVLALAREVETRRLAGVIDWIEDLGETNHLQYTRIRGAIK